jgi:hypothetical protein
MKQNPLATKAIFSINENSMHALKKKRIQSSFGKQISVKARNLPHNLSSLSLPKPPGDFANIFLVPNLKIHNNFQ